MTNKSLTEPRNGYISKDKCVFGAEVFVIKRQPVIENVCVLNLSQPYKHEWKIPEFSKLGSIWYSEEFFAGGYNWYLFTSHHSTFVFYSTPKPDEVDFVLCNVGIL